MAQADAHDVVPVTMLSGFLGAGQVDQRSINANTPLRCTAAQCVVGFQAKRHF